MKIGEQIVIDCESLQSLEALTADNWHDMAEADAKLVARRLVPTAGSPTHSGSSWQRLRSVS